MNTYPKKIMRLKELEKECGFPKEWLLMIYRNRGINRIYSIAWKQDETKKNSPILFDTDALERYRKSKCTGV